MYFVEEMTQSAIAEALGVGRVTVVRMLAEAKALGEVRIALSRGDAELGGLEAALVQALRTVRGDRRAALFGDRRPDRADRRRARRSRFGALAQRHEDRPRLGPHAQPFARISARAFAARACSVVSLVGGVTHFAHDNPAEFPSAFARAFNADCYLIPAPALVDSAGDQGGADRALRARRGLRFRPARSTRSWSASARSDPKRRSRASR